MTFIWVINNLVFISSSKFEKNFQFRSHFLFQKKKLKFVPVDNINQNKTKFVAYILYFGKN